MMSHSSQRFVSQDLKNPDASTMKLGVRRNYTIVNHDSRVALQISITEYCVFDLIHHLATNPKNNKNGWCYAKKETIADYLSLGRMTVFRAIKTGLRLGLLEKHREQPALLRTTRSWYETVQMHHEYQNDTPRTKKVLAPSQNGTPASINMRRNKEKNKENDKFAAEAEKRLTGIGDILKKNHLQVKEKRLVKEWQVEAIRLWQVLGLAGEPSQQFFKHIKNVYATKQHRKLARVISYCIDAPGVRDMEKFFYWRYAREI